MHPLRRATSAPIPSRTEVPARWTIGARFKVFVPLHVFFRPLREFVRRQRRLCGAVVSLALELRLEQPAPRKRFFCQVRLDDHDLVQQVRVVLLPQRL